jgi:hypothetical protein
MRSNKLLEQLAHKRIGFDLNPCFLTASNAKESAQSLPHGVPSAQMLSI